MKVESLTLDDRTFLKKIGGEKRKNEKLEGESKKWAKMMEVPAGGMTA